MTLAREEVKNGRAYFGIRNCCNVLGSVRIETESKAPLKKRKCRDITEKHDDKHADDKPTTF